MNKSCHTCELLAARDRGTAPLWDNIYRTGFWDVVHGMNTSLEGWLVLVVRRHIGSLDEMTGEESAELGPLIQKTSAALKEITGCEKTYVMQFAEHPQHPHVHFHITPRYVEQKDEHRAVGIIKMLNVPEDEQVSEARKNELGERIRKYLENAEKEG